MQIEADRLKRITVNGVPTKLVALGIGSGVNQGELNNIVSTPVDRNVFLAPDFSSLGDVEEQLRITSCPAPSPSNSSIFRVCSCDKNHCRRHAIFELTACEMTQTCMVQ